MNLDRPDKELPLAPNSQHMVHLREDSRCGELPIQVSCSVSRRSELPDSKMSVPCQWTSLIGMEDKSIRDSWSQHDTPVELSLLPATADPSPKLLEILQWSLDREDLDKRRQPTERQGLHDVAVYPYASIAATRHANDPEPDDQSSSSQPSSSHGSEGKDKAMSKTIGRLAAFTHRHASRKSSTSRLQKQHRSPENPVQLAECTSCFDDLPVKTLTQLSCTHYYCKACLSTLVMTSIQAETSYPPKCCLSKLPTATIVTVLDSKQMEIYKNKAAEYAVPVQDRWYCPNSTSCGKWIPPSKHRLRSSVERCPHCSTRICPACRGTAHAKRSDCPTDDGLDAAIALAESHGWRKCNQCKTFVERREGCLHMTCRCRYQFCYACGSRWHTCRCTEADVNRRQLELQRTRATRERIVQEEDAELQQALAMIRAMEMSEAQERQRRQREDEEAQRREAEQLAILEQQRQREEERRRQQQLALEQELKQAILVSMKLEADGLFKSMIEVIQLQHIALDDKLGREEARLKSSYEKLAKEQHWKRDVLLEGRRLAASVKLDRLRQEQEHERQQLVHHHEKLVGKDRDLQDALNDALRDLNLELNQALARAEVSLDREMSLLQRAIDKGLARAKMEHDRDIGHLITVATIERKWYLVVSERRLTMVHKHNLITASEIGSNQESGGLTAEVAATIEPLPAIVAQPHRLKSRHHSTGIVHRLSRALVSKRSDLSSSSSDCSFATAVAVSGVPAAASLRGYGVRDFAAQPAADHFSEEQSRSLMTKRHARQLTPPDLGDFARNGPQFIKYKRGESSTSPTTPDFSKLPDIATPPTPPETPPPPPPKDPSIVPRRKPLPAYMQQETRQRVTRAPLTIADNHPLDCQKETEQRDLHQPFPNYSLPRPTYTIPMYEVVSQKRQLGQVCDQ